MDTQQHEAEESNSSAFGETETRLTPVNRRDLAKSRRVVVKVGSGLLAPHAENRVRIDRERFRAIADDVADLISRGIEVVLVSSGSVACGLSRFKHARMPETVIDKHTAAAVGQTELLRRWSAAFRYSGITVGQMLITIEDLKDRRRFLNARHLAEALLVRGIVPVMNENDSVTFDEIRVGDNDTLSAHAAGLVSADLLIILTSVPGLIADSGRGALIDRVGFPHEARSHVSTDQTATGVGGFSTKINAAELALAHGIPTLIADGREPGILGRAIAGEPVGTLFESAGDATPLRKAWIGTAAEVKGTIYTDEGARRAVVERGASLLPKGVIRVEGKFGVSDVVNISTHEGQVYARGLAGYTAGQIALIAGRASEYVESILGFTAGDAIVHRDDLLVFDTRLGRLESVAVPSDPASRV